MTLFGQVIVGAVLFVALPFAFAWLFKYVYTFFQPLDKAIMEDRLREFELAGVGFGLVVAVILGWWYQGVL